MKLAHYVVFWIQLGAALANGLAGDYSMASMNLILCLWVYISAGNLRDARRYHFVREHLSVAVDSETGEAVKPPPYAMDRSVDRRMAEFRK